ncbi:jg17331 [Pararge aegeria aegeria]|uniref:Jg17331 protein n=1 Tax=Pararge aegeria aegeria TaxID=348720 RepID=A0A8S4SPM7_9NEOP|nr:jg17331 [Pararge aegeria aegeria]
MVGLDSISFERFQLQNIHVTNKPMKKIYILLNLNDGNKASANSLQYVPGSQRKGGNMLCICFFGHVSRRNDVSIERLVVQGKVEGTRARGRSPMRWTDQVKATIEAHLHECARKATVREEWRNIVKRATTPR